MSSFRELIRRFEPVLRFGTDGAGRPELFFPMSARDYVHDCGLRRRKVGWLRRPGDALLAHLGLVPQPEECYLAYAAGDLDGDPALEAGALSQLLDSGLELARAPEGESVALETLAGRGVAPRILLAPQQAVELAQALSGVTAVEVSPVAPGDLAAWPGEKDAVASISAHKSAAGASQPDDLESVVAGLQWLQFPALAPLSKAIRQRALQKYVPYRDWNRFPPVYHYHVSRDRGYTVLHYYFLYPYNDWASHGGHNDHEGDWEVVYVFLDDQEAPRHVAYSKHISIPFLYGPDTAAWTDVETVEGAHPVVYVGCGSHASYLKKGEHRFFLYIDRAKGDYLAIGPSADQPWGDPISLAVKPWNSHFSGFWGALVRSWFGKVLPHTEGPTGPAHKGDKWRHPAKWAGIA